MVLETRTPRSMSAGLRARVCARGWGATQVVENLPGKHEVQHTTKKKKKKKGKGSVPGLRTGAEVSPELSGDK
jgi:hypothetical protein